MIKTLEVIDNLKMREKGKISTNFHVNKYNFFIILVGFITRTHDWLILHNPC